jgi:hypothetical protein
MVLGEPLGTTLLASDQGLHAPLGSAAGIGYWPLSEGPVPG